MRWKGATPYLFILPFYIMFAAFWIFPILSSFYYSFGKWDGFSPIEFVGLANYTAILRDSTFYVALTNTILYLVIYNAIMIGLAIIIALMIDFARIKGKGFFHASYFAPVTVSLAVVAFVFDILLARAGLVNNLLRLIGFSAEYGWLRRSDSAMWAIILMRVWRATGYYSAFILAGLMSIPKELYEVAKIDGARTLTVIGRVTLPLIKPVLMFVMVMSTTWSLQLFDEPWILTQGGPAQATLTMQIYIYQSGFLFFRLGYASALSYILAVITILLAMVYFKVFKKE